MTNTTEREAASERQPLGATRTIVTGKGSANFSHRNPTAEETALRLKNRTKSQVEKELDAFWENVPL